jgi:hypothetical protein
LQVDDNAGVRSIIFPACKNLRKLTHQIVYILSLTVLLDNTRIDHLTRFISSSNQNISFGARDAILDALLQEKTVSNKGGLHFSFRLAAFFSAMISVFQLHEFFSKMS